MVHKSSTPFSLSTDTIVRGEQQKIFFVFAVFRKLLCKSSVKGGGQILSFVLMFIFLH